MVMLSHLFHLPAPALSLGSLPLVLLPVVMQSFTRTSEAPVPLSPARPQFSAVQLYSLTLSPHTSIPVPSAPSTVTFCRTQPVPEPTAATWVASGLAQWSTVMFFRMMYLVFPQLELMTVRKPLPSMVTVPGAAASKVMGLSAVPEVTIFTDS